MSMVLSPTRPRRPIPNDAQEEDMIAAMWTHCRERHRTRTRRPSRQYQKNPAQQQHHLRILLVLVLVAAVWNQWTGHHAGVAVCAFTCLPIAILNHREQYHLPQQQSNMVEVPVQVHPQAALLHAAPVDKKRRKRKRKNIPTDDSAFQGEEAEQVRPVATTQKNSPPDPAVVALPVGSTKGVDEDDDDENDRDDKQQVESVDIQLLNEIASFKFNPNKKDENVADSAGLQPPPGNRGTAIPLPDIREARRMKQLEEELAKKAQEEESNKVRIKRSDKEAFRQLLEQQPFADADDSLFVEEEYGAVSALLGERAKPFLGIPLGPLQVGHFIGSLGIILMAFVEYPGFPLTNLPTPLRTSLQGGLATIYTINAVLACFVAFKAPERGQPLALWIPKTLAVGGLAFDQLMQLPTLDEVEKAKAVKGRRALKNKRK